MTHTSVLSEQAAGSNAMKTGATPSGWSATRGAQGCAIDDRALDRLERHLGWRPTRALAARFLNCAEPRALGGGADRWFVRFRVFGQSLLAEMRMGGDEDGAAVWVATHPDHGVDGRARHARACTA